MFLCAAFLINTFSQKNTGGKIRFQEHPNRNVKYLEHYENSLVPEYIRMVDFMFQARSMFQSVASRMS